MAINVNLSIGLRAWIADNLARGAPPAAMIEALVSRNFDPAVAGGLIDAFISAQAGGRPLPELKVRLDMEAPRYVYEAPRIAPGHVIRACDREIRVLQRLQSPVLATLERVLSDEECERLIGMARPRLRRSTVIDAPTGADVTVDRRSSEGMFFRLRENPFIAQIDERLAVIMNCPAESGEGLQVLHYGPGGQYPPHFDFLVPSSPASSRSIARSGQRISTLIVYLNDVIEGGETLFPEAGLSVVPRRGNGLYFEYTNSRMQVDLRSAHGGAPVIRGEKWIVTKWMRSRKFVPASDSQGGATDAAASTAVHGRVEASAKK
ncbi:MAG: 2OG-Fe(II) oxygenase [Nevskia sp.]|nr:2OG-Fe(II) oxygenase [Nevskia sp.]